MKLRPIGTMPEGGQDGAFWGKYAFRFDDRGHCRVYDARILDRVLLEDAEPTVLPLVTTFSIDPEEPLLPHCNAVVFGKDYYASDDPYPLLYANVYNNYAKAEDRLEGTLCVYRLTEQRIFDEPGVAFQLHLQQVIRIGFTNDPLWCTVDPVAVEDGAAMNPKTSTDQRPSRDLRPFGNFVIDRQEGLLHAFTMRDGDHCTRYFTFALPSPVAGEMSPEWGVPVVTLEKEDVRSYFDVEYHNFLQGACCHRGLIYSTEGFGREVPPAIRVIDPMQKKQLAWCDLLSMGYEGEAEWIDFRRGVCCYSDAAGRMYAVNLDE